MKREIKIDLYLNHWLFWAVLSACFGALTAIFAKVGLSEVDADFATLIRTFIIFFVLLFMVIFLNKWQNPILLSGKIWLFLTLSALARGASWLAYFRALQMGTAS